MKEILWILHKTLWLSVGILSLAIAASADDFKMVFVGLFCVFMYNFWCFIEHLPEIENTK